MKLVRYLPVVLVLGVLLSACQTAPAPVVTPAPTTPPPTTASPPAAPASIAAKPISLDAARNIANNCFTCHGPEGRSPGSIPSLDLLGADRIAAKLRDFKNGSEASTVMGRHAKAYTDAEIEAVARYIATLKK